MNKFLYQPVKPFIINQHFGENLSCVDIATNSKVITCDGLKPPAGYRSLYGPRGHLALDLATGHGQPVYCACEGKVMTIDTNPRSGLDVRVVSQFQGKIYRHIYEHLLGYQPKIGDTIKTGDLIGWADNTGYSSGDHLHFQVEEWKDNGWVAIDPLPIMFETFALQVDVVRRLKEIVAILAERLADMMRKTKK